MGGAGELAGEQPREQRQGVGKIFDRNMRDAAAAAMRYEPALAEHEIRRFGEYRTARLVLAAWDRLESGAESRCSPAFT